MILHFLSYRRCKNSNRKISIIVGARLGLSGIINTSKVMLFVGPPIALNEITLSVWLIVKGFNPSAKTEINQTH